MEDIVEAVGSERCHYDFDRFEHVRASGIGSVPAGPAGCPLQAGWVEIRQCAPGPPVRKPAVAQKPVCADTNVQMTCAAVAIGLTEKASGWTLPDHCIGEIKHHTVVKIAHRLRVDGLSSDSYLVDLAWFCHPGTPRQGHPSREVKG
jgi:hypothetical protein